MRHLHICFSVIIFIVGSLISFKLQATHIRAGEITAIRQPGINLKYLFVITAYLDTDSDIEFGGGEIDFGDGTTLILDEGKADEPTIKNLGNKVEQVIFTIYHTYQSPGNYTVGYREQNRNAGILNMNNSVETPFYIETKLLIDPFLGINNTPVLLIPPVDRAAKGATFFHNPGAFDEDGDSLSYKLVIPKQDKNEDVINYRFPNDPEFGGTTEANDGPATLTLDPITGDLVWDAPGDVGEYNIAFIVEEWRKVNNKWYKLGYVTRDMQIIVEESTNERPELQIPKDTCVIAGTLLEETITATDPNNHDVFMEAFGGPFNLLFLPAEFSPSANTKQSTSPDPAKLNFTWQTDCSHVREEPYQVQFKATDSPPPLEKPALTDIKTWRITIVGPKPTGLLGGALTPERYLPLQWDEYTCKNSAVEMQLWRRIGNDNFEPDNCQTGIPENAGYELIAKLDINQNTFLDTNNGNGLAPGAVYCYRLVAIWPEPGGGESLASEPYCVELAADAPIITNVDINKTGENDGEVFVRWTSPFEIDEILFPPPYTYKVYRADGFSGTNSITEVLVTSDTFFTDSGLNTLERIYNYRVYLFDNNDILLDSSAVASTVRLEPQPLIASIELTWDAEVPWTLNLPEYKHYIYRNRVDFPQDEENFKLIDSVEVNGTGFIYVDNGNFNNVELSDKLSYCYFVETWGSYGNGIDSLINKSQIVCANPNDTIPPCTPIVVFDANDPSLQNFCKDFLENKPCSFNDFSNTITWSKQDTSFCDDDIKSFNVYFSPIKGGAFEKIANVTDTFFVHENLSSFAGCYQISAVDRSGNESFLSEPFCRDNCPYYEIPNIFTPNGDGINDVLRAYDESSIEFYQENKCPRFVESVKFSVFTRSGNKIYEYASGGENSIFINWDGYTNNKQKLDPGVYYYLLEVKFITVDPDNAIQKFKGWIQVWE